MVKNEGYAGGYVAKVFPVFDVLNNFFVNHRFIGMHLNLYKSRFLKKLRLLHPFYNKFYSWSLFKTISI